MTTACRLPRQTGRPVRGVTLVELVMAVGLVAVLAVFALPSFADISRRHRVEVLKDHFIASIHLARAEAMRLGQPVVLRRVEPCPEAAARGDWPCGWQVFADANGNHRLDEEETLLEEAPMPPHTLLRKAGAVNPSAVAFDRHGQVTQAGTRIEIHPAGQGYSAVDGVLICLPAGSRVRTVRAASKC